MYLAGRSPPVVPDEGWNPVSGDAMFYDLYPTLFDVK